MLLLFIPVFFESVGRVSTPGGEGPMANAKQPPYCINAQYLTGLGWLAVATGAIAAQSPGINLRSRLILKSDTLGA